MITIHFKSDFDFQLELRDALGNPIGWPEFDWALKLRTESSRREWVAFRRGNMTKGCYNDDGKLHIVADGHGLGPGRLLLEFCADIRNEHYADGVQRVVCMEPIDIRLTDRGGCAGALCIGKVSVCLPATGTMSESDVRKAIEMHAAPFLWVDAEGRLVAEGVGPLLERGLTPVVFRCLWRNNKNTADDRVRSRRWTRFTKLADAVMVDAETGVVSFRDDLLCVDKRKSAVYTTAASALVATDEGVFYGRCLFELSDTKSLRMMNLPFILGFADLTGDTPARRTTPADCALRLPFRVRYTPVAEYADGSLKHVTHRFGFDFK